MGLFDQGTGGWRSSPVTPYTTLDPAALATPSVLSQPGLSFAPEDVASFDLPDLPAPSPYDLYATEFTAQGTPGITKDYMDYARDVLSQSTADRTLTWADPGLQPSAGNWQYRGGPGASSTNSSFDNPANWPSGAIQPGRLQGPSSTGNRFNAAPSAAPPRSAPVPFGSPTFQWNKQPGDTGQPATGSKDTAFFIEQLRRLVENPSSVASNPAYQFLMDQGMNALNRTAAAKRKRFAGGTLLEAEKYGQGLAGVQYDMLAKVLTNALRGATGQYQADVGRWLAEQNLGQGMDVNNYIAWQNQQREAGAQQGRDLLLQLLQSIGPG